MSKKFLSALVLVGMLALHPAWVPAAEIQTPLTEEELTLHPGDTIRWTPSSVHRIQFGGKVRKDTITLPSFEQVKKVLQDITLDPPTPALEVTGDIAKSAQLQKVVATVRPDAATAGVPEFFFTCGFNNTHGNDMVTVSFKFAPAPAGAKPRTVEIITTNDPPAPNHRFLLKTAAGEKSLTRKP